MAAPVAVSARGWGWRHATRKAWAVRGLDLDVAPGERVLLLGASGSGKSTLLAGLAGLLDPQTGQDQGELLLDGVPARRARTEAIGAGQARTGLLLQDPLAQTVLARVGDDVAFGLENHAVPRAEIWPRVDEALAAVGFTYGRGHSTGRLSGGERQRLALAGVLALRPGLLLLDEPTAMLDPDGGDLLRQAVGEVLASTGATCLVVEHRVAPWLPFVNRVVVLEPGGGVLADGAPDDVLQREADRLAAAGIWLPTPTPPPHPTPRRDHAVSPTTPPPPPRDHAVLTTGRGLAVARPALFGGRAEPAVRDVDLDLQAGRALAVVGPNGAGKSTLALALSGLVAPAAGELVARPGLAVRDGVDAGSSPHTWRPRALVRRIGTVFQEPAHQFVTSTVAAELAVGPDRLGTPAARRQARVTELLERLRLDHLARANPFTLSGGEQRRLSVATVLATDPRLLVLDEPTFGQDARTWAELVALLLDVLAGGAAVVAVTHDEALAATLTHGGQGDVLRLVSGRPATPVPVST